MMGICRPLSGIVTLLPIRRLVALVGRMHAHGGVAEHRLGARRAEADERVRKTIHRIFKGPEAALGVVGIGFIVGHGGLQLGVPVHQAFAAENQAVLEEAKEGVPHGSAHIGVEREARAGPVAARAERLELAEDALLVLFLPLPDAFHEFVAAEVVAGFLLGLANAPLHHRLGGDAGVIRARHVQASGNPACAASG